jgi:hypothetical protein
MGQSLAPRRDSFCQFSLWNRKESSTRKHLSEKEKKRCRRAGDGALNYLALPLIGAARQIVIFQEAQS